MAQSGCNAFGCKLPAYGVGPFPVQTGAAYMCQLSPSGWGRHCRQAWAQHDLPARLASLTAAFHPNSCIGQGCWLAASQA